MELLLNLAWLLLALPAYWLWRERGAMRKSGFQCLLALGCLLVVLFPVISATDDLQAMRTEMEESSGASKRTLRQASGEKSHFSSGQNPALIVPLLDFSNLAEERYHLAGSSPSISAAPAAKPSGRGPPTFQLV